MYLPGNPETKWLDMINKTEAEERQYLEEMKGRLQSAIKGIDDHIEEYSRQLREEKKYLYENKTGMDRMEKNAVRQTITLGALTGEAAVERKKKLQKLLDSPYFGRMDFLEAGRAGSLSIYIGLFSFFEEALTKNLIHDWRAPISSMYYDFEPGIAHYEAPTGRIRGEMQLKRQYRIRNGVMEFMLENSFNVYDDILQKELSRASDDRMKNIVATIQHDQNEIIRNEESRVLIIQGVAGSGKTSIALHRIAFLLYRFREKISSGEILIISPNKVFADYISNVLPELGEERIPEKGMEELASELLENKIRFQTFFEQVDQLLEKKDEGLLERIRFKSSSGFLNLLDQYIAHVENNYFKPEDIWIKRNYVPGWFIKERFEATHRFPVLKRFNEIVKSIEENIRIYYDYEISVEERKELRTRVMAMFRITNLRELHKDFYSWMEKPHLLQSAARGILEYADVFPFIYLKIRLEGSKSSGRVKHLLVDEMQDYSAIQYAVLSRIFHCKMTILGDVSQSINPISSSSVGDIAKIFPDADLVKLLRSYRSTYEITEFAQQIFPDKDLIAIERHGKPPEVKSPGSPKEEMLAIQSWIQKFRQSEHQSLGIICKTQKQAEKLFEALNSDNKDSIYLLTPESRSFSSGVMVTSVHMAKGLEFDQVIVPFSTHANYKTESDRRVLYIACTRAMHELMVCGNGNMSGFLIG